MPRRAAALFGELLQRVGSGDVPLPVEAVYPFEQARDAAAASAVPGRGRKDPAALQLTVSQG